MILREVDDLAAAINKLRKYNEPLDFTPLYALQSILKSSLGPKGTDKLISDQLGDFLITNDGATILKNLPIVHPAARVLVDIALSQDKQIGDGTTTTVLFACELISQAERLMDYCIHPTIVVDGILQAVSEATNLLNSLAQIPTSLQDIPSNQSSSELQPPIQQGSQSQTTDGSARTKFLSTIAATSLSSKIIGASSDHFAPMAVQSVSMIQSSLNGKLHFDMKRIRFEKVLGGQVESSSVISGHALLLKQPLSSGMPTRVSNGRVLVVNYWVKPKAHEMSYETSNFAESQRLAESNEEEKTQAMRVVNTGANVLITSKTLSRYALRLLADHNVMVVQSVSEEDLGNIALAAGTSVLSSLVQLSDEKEKLGNAGLVEQALIQDAFVLYIICQDPKSCTVLLRGPSYSVMDEIERSLHDAQCMIVRTLENPLVLPGGGACEMEVAMHIKALASKANSTRKFVLEAFAESLLFLPRTLTLNAGLDPTSTLSLLQQAHESKEGFWKGIDLDSGKIEDMMNIGVLEPVGVKVGAMTLAVEAACTLIKASGRAM